MNRALTGHSPWRARRLTRRLPQCNEALLLILFRVAFSSRAPEASRRFNDFRCAS